MTGVTGARDELVSVSSNSRGPKLVVKIAPDLNEAQLIDVASAIKISGVDGVIISNTTTSRPSSLSNRENPFSPNVNSRFKLFAASKIEQGGLSGAPLKQYTLKALKTLRSNLPASIPLIGCGGISTGADALEYAKAGASLVQIYTSFGYDGVGACRRIKDELSDLLAKENTTWKAVVEQSVTSLSYKQSSTTEGSVAKDGSVSLLIEEAKELGKLLDKLADSFGTDQQEAFAVPPSTT